MGTLPAWTGPVSDDVRTLDFTLAITATDALYSRTVAFTLSTSTP